MSELSDDDLDDIISQIVKIFPNFGRCMIDGHLRHLGHYVPRSHIQASCAHVHGAPASSFGPHHIQCRVYSVPGPNSLAHHDGQHGMLLSFTITLILLKCPSLQVLYDGRLCSMASLTASHILSLASMPATTIGQRLSFSLSEPHQSSWPSKPSLWRPWSREWHCCMVHGDR